MITTKKLKELLDKIPENSRLVAYEGESTGLRVIYKNPFNSVTTYGWIETGDDDYVECDNNIHDTDLSAL